MRVQRVLESYGVYMDEDKLLKMDATARRAVIFEAQTDALKAKEEETRRTMEQAKRVDYICRALRLEAAEAVKARYSSQLNEDSIAYATNVQNLSVTLVEKHKVDLEEKHRLQKIQQHRSGFETLLLAKQRATYDAEMAKLRKRLIKERRDQNVARAHNLRFEELVRSCITPGLFGIYERIFTNVSFIHSLCLFAGTAARSYYNQIF